jgi:hypothetical protein
MLYGTEGMAHIYSGETAVDYTESLYGHYAYAAPYGSLIGGYTVSPWNTNQ